MSRMDIRDIPITSGNDDYLNIDKYAQALTSFIQTSQLPITISLQGEWGSGKSSLMNIMSDLLCDGSEAGFEHIWINTWEISLQGDEKDLIEHLSMMILKEMRRIAKEKNVVIDQEFEDVMSSFKKYLFKTSDLLLSLNGVDEAARRKAISVFDQGGWTHIAQIRDKIAKVVNLLIESNNGLSNQGFVLFIDDLDRIEPQMAVKLLEVLKNLFVIDHCVFVLAVDYEVIVKGLRSKYGEALEADDKTYKSYFDKLIQLPFVMPIQKYDIKNYLFKGLDDIGYFESIDCLSKRHKDYLEKAVLLTVGKNPRAIKRLMNVIKLSKIFDETNENILVNNSMKLANMIFVCMQMAYPKLYGIYEQNLHKSEEDRTITDEMLEEICSPKRAVQLKKFISMMEDVIEYDEQLNKQAMNRIVSLSALTHMTYQIEEEPLQYSGEDYNLSSETQHKQGSKLIDTIDRVEGNKVLDVGCGNGRTTIELWEKFPKLNIDAFDLSQSQIKTAKANLKAARVSENHINFFQKDATTVDYDGKYDLVFSNATLHWIVEAKDMYTKLYKALKPNGRIAIHQGGFKSYYGLHKAVVKAIESCGYESCFADWTYPIYYPTQSDMEEMLEAIGFMNIEVNSHATDGKEHHNLIDNFKNASLLPYLNRLPDEIAREKVIEAYYDICTSTDIDTYTHRLYIYASKE